MTEMKRTWLIQRLQKPKDFALGGIKLKDNPFSFGGGYKNGGLSSEAMDLIRTIWSFDYMGAAEFEFGAVPKALQTMATTKNLIGFGIEIALKDVDPHWKEKKTKTVREGTAVVYVLCPEPWCTEVEERIRRIAKEGYRSELKEGTNLSSTLRPYDDWDGSAVGWLELDNGFMFFTDREMFEKTLQLFEVKEEAVA